MSKKWTAEEIPSQHGKTVVVTGSNSGIGLIAAKELAAKGARVVMACRSLDKANKAADDIRARHEQAEVQVMQLDVANLASVADFATTFCNQFESLDVLINNAGVMGFPELTHTTDGFEAQFGTNHLGHFALTAQLFDLLRATPASRVVTVGSVAHRSAKGMDFDNLNFENGDYKTFIAYARSKLANMLFMYELDRRLRAAGHDMISAASHPGYSATNITSSANPNNSAIKNFFMVKIGGMMGMPPWKGALPSLYAATMPDVQGGEYIGPTGLFGFWGWPDRCKPHADALNEQYATKLWEVSEKLTGVPFKV